MAKAQAKLTSRESLKDRRIATLERELQSAKNNGERWRLRHESAVREIEELHGGPRRPWLPFTRADYAIANSGRLTLTGEIDSAAETWVNNFYQVSKYPPRVHPEMGRIVHLSICRLDRAAVHDWRHLQRIKNELVGPQIEAIELYPAEARLVDAANQFHLWCFPDVPVIPVGFTERLVLDERRINGLEASVQRPFAPGDERELTPIDDAKVQQAIDAMKAGA